MKKRKKCVVPVAHSRERQEVIKMEKTLRSILEHRNSIRKFTGEQITEQELTTVLEAANAAPVAMRLYDDLQIFVIQNQELLEQLDKNAVKVYQEKMGMKNTIALFHTPTLIIVAAKRNIENIRDGLYCTAGCMVENMALAATELELGNVYLMGVTVALNYNEELKKQVGIPEDYEAVSALAIGKTDVAFTKRDLSVPRFKVQRIGE